MRVARRNLFVTLRMLTTAGIEADAHLIGERIQVRVRHPEPGSAPLVASFEGTEIVLAADWLAACVVQHYPSSDLAKVWALVVSAGATLSR